MSEAHSTYENEDLKSSLKTAKSQVDGLRELVPQQLADEVKLATTTLKDKGISLGVAAGLAVGALLLISFVVISIVVALINVVALWLPGWAAALIVAAFFILVAALLGLIGFLKVKKALPLTPDQAIRGLRHDIGVLKEGSAFDEAALDEPLRKKKDEESDEKKDETPKPPALSVDELLLRTKRRRRQIQALRDNLASSLRGPRAKAEKMHRAATHPGDAVHDLAAKARVVIKPSSPVRDLSPSDRKLQSTAEKAKPAALLIGAAVGLAALSKRLFRKE